MWPFPVARDGSGCACCNAWREEGPLRTAFLQNNHVNFHIGFSVDAWWSGVFLASLPPTPITVTGFKPSSSEPPLIPKTPLSGMDQIDART